MRLLSQLMFGIRLLTFIFSAWMSCGNTAFVVTAVYVIVTATWIVDFIAGRTLWVSARLGLFVAQMVFLSAMAVVYVTSRHYSVVSLNLLIICPLMLIAISSDAIANSTRWKLLLPTIPVIWVLGSELTHSIYPPFTEGHLFQIPYAVIVYSLIAGLAAFARLYFVPTTHLLHSSLDYAVVRLEILSEGMKRPVAIGIKHNRADSIRMQP